MRNELVEELIVDREAKVMQDRTGKPLESAKPTGWRAKQVEGRRKGEPAEKSGHEAPLGEASLSEKKDAFGCQDRVRPSPTRAR
jgi:hypothetical protein